MDGNNCNRRTEICANKLSQTCPLFATSPFRVSGLQHPLLRVLVLVGWTGPRASSSKVPEIRFRICGSCFLKQSCTSVCLMPAEHGFTATTCCAHMRIGRYLHLANIIARLANCRPSAPAQQFLCSENAWPTQKSKQLRVGDTLIRNATPPPATNNMQLHSTSPGDHVSRIRMFHNYGRQTSSLPNKSVLIAAA